MSRDRQIAVVASILGLAGLIIGIVAISQDSGAEDEWIRNRALPGAASSEEAVLQTQVAVQEVADLTERVAEIERLDTLAERASTEAEEQSDTTNVAVQGMTNEVADLTERVAELEKTPLPAGPEEVTPTFERPTEEVDYADEELDQTPLPADESGVTVELTEELLTPPPTTTEPESLEPIADVLDSSAGTDEEGDANSLWARGGEIYQGMYDDLRNPNIKLGVTAYISSSELERDMKGVVATSSSSNVVLETYSERDRYLEYTIVCPDKIVTKTEEYETEPWEYAVGILFPPAIPILPTWWEDASSYTEGPYPTVHLRANFDNANYWIVQHDTLWPTFPDGVDQEAVVQDYPNQQLKDAYIPLVIRRWGDGYEYGVTEGSATIRIMDLNQMRMHYAHVTVYLSWVPAYKGSTTAFTCSAAYTVTRSYH